jgi:soluble lytic murein transglycosylase-like protein
MSLYYFDEDGDWEYADLQVTPDEFAGGCLPHMVIPPLAVLVISAILFFAMSNLTLAATAPPSAFESAPPAPEELSNITNAGSGQLAALFSPEVRHWEPQILVWASEWNLDPNLIATVMQIESCGDPEARSTAGAAGLFQVMPFHFAAGENAYDPQTNARRGLSYLQNALEAHAGQSRLALVGYNGGINGSKRPESSWPAETVRYAYWGEGIYEDARAGRSHSARLNEWLSSGGSSLCSQANQHLGLNQ